MDILERRQVIEQARAFLRNNDFAVGYIPQMIYGEQASEWFSIYWFCVRKMDDAFDNGAYNSNLDLENFLAYLSKEDSLFYKALHLFMSETAHLVPKKLLEEIYTSILIEKKHYSDGKPQSLSTYLSLIEKRSIIPFYIVGLICGIPKDSPYLMPMCRYFGRSIQLLDDLMDIRVDLEAGRFYITQEELELLGISEEEVRNHPELVCTLRNKLFIEVSTQAYLISAHYWDTEFGLHVRSVIEGAWKMIEDGRAIPLPKSIVNHNLFYSHYVGATSLPYDVMNISENLKYHLFHKSALIFLKKYKAFDLEQARDLLSKIDIECRHLVDIICSDIQGPEEFHLDHIKQKIASDDRIFYELKNGYGLPIATKALFRDVISNFNKDMNKAIQTNQQQTFFAEVVKSLIGVQRSVNQEIFENVKGVIGQTTPAEQSASTQPNQQLFQLFEIAHDHSMKFFEEVVDYISSSNNTSL